MFENIDNLWEDIKKSKVLKEEDTSIMFYCLNSLNNRIDHIKNSFPSTNTLHTTAIKTNPHPSILKYIIKRGFGLEAASFEEVKLAFSLGCPANRIVYNSPVKTTKEILYCSKFIPNLYLNANNLDEFQNLPNNHNFSLGLRINPLIKVKTNDIYNVSHSDSKFGVPISQKKNIINTIVKNKVDYLHVHVGSRIKDYTSIIEGIGVIYNLAEDINSSTPNRIKGINIGGGLFAGHNDCENIQLMKDFTQDLSKSYPDLFLKYKIITEYGQWTHKFNGCAFTTIEYITDLLYKKIAYVHLGADMFLREIYTDFNHIDIGVVSSNSSKLQVYDIAGPLCYNGDYLAKDIKLPEFTTKDILYLNNIGANTFGLWSRHCSRTIPIFVTRNMNNNINIISERKNPFI